jgi:hypothetical protein
MESPNEKIGEKENLWEKNFSKKEMSQLHIRNWRHFILTIWRKDQIHELFCHDLFVNYASRSKEFWAGLNFDHKENEKLSNLILMKFRTKGEAKGNWRRRDVIGLKMRLFLWWMKMENINLTNNIPELNIEWISKK